MLVKLASLSCAFCNSQAGIKLQLVKSLNRWDAHDAIPAVPWKLWGRKQLTPSLLVGGGGCLSAHNSNSGKIFLTNSLWIFYMLSGEKYLI